MTFKLVIELSVSATALFLAGGRCRAASATDLMAKSDAVVIATAVSSVSGAENTVIKLSVHSWLLSDGTPANFIDVIWTAPAEVRQRAEWDPPASAGIWFLKRSAAGEHSALEIRHPAVMGTRDLFFRAPSSSCPSAFEYPSSAEVEDKVALAMACQSALDATHQMFPADVLDFVRSTTVSQRVKAAFRYMAQMSGSRQKAIGIAGMIEANDPAGILTLEEHLSEISPEDLNQIVARPFFASWRSPDVAATESLGRMATKPLGAPVLSLSMTTALGAIHSAATLPYLIQLMDSDERQVRINAVGGFVAFVNGLPIRTAALGTERYLRPSETPWRSAETESRFGLNAPAGGDLESSIAFWKDWWQAHKAAIDAATK